MGPAAKTELPQFTGLRGIATLLVLFAHIRTPQGIELQFGFLDAFSKHGRLGVDLFFVLSGFILSHVYGNAFRDGRETLASYAKARFSRIYPLHFATIFLMLGAYAVATRMGVRPTETAGYSLEATLLSLLLVHKWFGFVAPNPGSWSISVELANYLLFPFLVAYVLRLPMAALLAVILAGAAIAEYTADLHVLCGLTEFVMGCAGYALARSVNLSRMGVLAGPVLVAPFFFPAPGFAALCFTATVMLLFAPARDPFQRICSSRALVFVGDISYSIYLLQWVIWIAWKHVLANSALFAGRPYLMATCAAASVIAISIPSYYLFERPTRVWLRAFWSKPRRLPAA